MALLMVVATLYGVLQLVVLSSPARSVRLPTVLLAVVTGVYGSGVLAALLEFVYTRCAAGVTGQPMAVVVTTAGYSVDPVIEELAKVVPLLVLGASRRIRAQWGLTDFAVLGAGLGAGFGLLEPLARYAQDAHRAIAQPGGGWTIPVSLYPPYVPGVSQVFGSWLPAPAGTFESTVGVISVDTNAHLVWSMAAGLAVGLLLRVRGWRRSLALVPFAAAAAHHILDNYTALHAYGPAESVVEPLDAWLWVAPLVVLAFAMACDIARVRGARRTMPETLLAAEREGRPAAAVLAAYASWCVPWTVLIALRFVRIRRCLAYASTVSGPAELEPLRRQVGFVAERIDASDREDAWQGLEVRRALQGVRPRVSAARCWLTIASWALAVPSLVLLGVGTFPSTAGIESFLGSGAGPSVFTGLGMAGLVLVGSRLVMLLADGDTLREIPFAEALAVVRWRICIALGSAVAGVLLFCRSVDGAGPAGMLVSNFHLLDALSDFEVYLGFAMILLALLVLFPPGALVVAGGGGLLAAGVTADAVATAAGLGSVGVLLMAAGARGGERPGQDSGDDGGGRGGGRSGDKSAQSKPPAERAKALGYDRRVPPQKAPFNSHGQQVFTNGKTYITPDVDAHNVTDGWKMFDRRGNRLGTYDGDLNRIKG